MKTSATRITLTQPSLLQEIVSDPDSLHPDHFATLSHGIEFSAVTTSDIQNKIIDPNFSMLAHRSLRIVANV